MNKSDVSVLYSNLFLFLLCYQHSVLTADLKIISLNTQDLSITVYHNIPKKRLCGRILKQFSTGILGKKTIGVSSKM